MCDLEGSLQFTQQGTADLKQKGYRRRKDIHKNDTDALKTGSCSRRDPQKCEEEMENFTSLA